MNSSRNVKIGTKLVAGFATGLVITAVVGGIGYIKLADTAKATESIYVDQFLPVQYVSEANAALLVTRGDAWRLLQEPDAAGRRTMAASIQQNSRLIVERMDLYARGPLNSRERSLVERFRVAYPLYAGGRDQAVEAAMRMDTKGATDLLLSTRQHSDAVRRTMDELTEANASAAKEQAAQSDAAAATARATIAILTLVGILLASGAAYYLVRSLTRKLRESIFHLDAGACQVAGAASQVSSLSQALAQGAAEQAASLEETSASTEEIQTMARTNADRCQRASDLVVEAGGMFQKTNEALAQMVTAMSDINASGEKISKIIRVIDEIAFQTNILALNAAVEAARAGEAGMGFAVVADEVRNLAQRCAQAARDTTALIEESVAKSRDGQARLTVVEQSVQDITGNATQVKELVETVVISSREQSRGIEQIGSAVNQMNQLTQRQAASSEEGAAAAEELNAQSSTVRDIVAGLALVVNGHAG